MWLKPNTVRRLCRLYPFYYGRGAIVNLCLSGFSVPPGTVCDFDGGMQLELLSDQYTSKEIWLFGVAEAREVALLKRLVPPGGTVIDVGANVGQYALLAAKLTGSSGHVFAFEPDELNFAVLSRNIERNGFSRCITALKLAVAGEAGQRLMEIRADRTRNVLRAKDRGDETAVTLGSGVSQVDTVTLDTFDDAHGLPRLDLLKIDVEGAELEVLRGAESLIRRFHPAIMVEFDAQHLSAYGTAPNELLAFLDACGYTYRLVNARGVQRPPFNGRRGGNLFCRPGSANP